MDALQPSLSGGEISPKLHGRVDLPKYNTALANALNCQITAEGSASFRPGLEYVAEVTDASEFFARNIDFEFNNEQTYQLEFANLTMRVIRDGVLVLDGSPATVTAISAGTPAMATAAAHGFAVNDEVYLSGITSMPSLSDRTFYVASTTTNTFTFKDRFGNLVDGSGLTAFAGSGSVEKVYEIATPYPSSALRQLKYVQSADTMWLFHPDYATRKLTRTGHASWTISEESYTADIAAPASVALGVSGALGSASTTLRYVVTAVNDDTGEESVASSIAQITGPTPDTWPAGVHVGVSCATVTGATRYRVYKSELGLFGFIGSMEGNSFNDRNITPDISQTPPIAQNPFAGVGDYPSCGTFFEQRMIRGGSDNRPAAIDGSKIGAFSNYNYSRPALATDALQFSLVSRKVNKVVSLVPLDNLVALTTDSEFVIRGAGDDDFLSATNPGRPKAQTYYGAADIDALVIGSSGLFVQADGQTIRDMGYEFVRNSYGGADLSILARHLVDGRQVVSWAYAQYPDSLVYVVFDDGSAACFSYIRETEERAVAWAPMETDGLFEDVSVIREGARDVPYFIVKRTINGVEKRYQERLASRDFTSIEDAFFVDSGRTYSGDPATVIYGLDHLRGEAVVALADGDVVENLTVADNGSVTLEVPASKVHVGKPYSGLIRMLPLSLLQQAGGASGRRKRISDLVLKVYKTRGVKTGPDEDHLTTHKDSIQPHDEVIQPFTGNLKMNVLPKWGDDAQLVIRQDFPLPMTVQSILMDVSTENG